ncbi:MAG: uracil-DNA glycosylase [Deltaproteobacteria bacterium]|nr:uracil-DNA glycosylase [Deltaproteobacteria bacterium]
MEHPQDIRQDVAEVILSLENHFKFLKRAGMHFFYPAPAPDRQEPVGSEALPRDADSGALLEQVRQELGACTRCRLHETRTQILFGEGNPAARLVFVGEAPGEEEDLQGRLFVGEAGRLLTRIIEAIQLQRSDVYIVNVLKCRPPSSRSPADDEIVSCIPFLRQQIEAIRPDIICTLGNTATAALLQTSCDIHEMRGDFHQYGSAKLMPTYPPEFLLKNPARKKDAWVDMQRVQKEYLKRSGSI